MKSFFQRYNDSHIGTSKPSKEPYKPWLPSTKPDVESTRIKAASRHVESADPGISARRHGEGKQHHSSSRAPRPEAYAAPPTPTPAYHYATVPASSKGRHTSSHPPVPPNLASQPPPPQSYAQIPSRGQPQKALPEVHDPRVHLHKRTGIVPSPQSSLELVSGLEEGAKTSRHARSRSAQVPAPPAPPPAPEVSIPQPQEPSSSSRKHREKENDGERDRERQKAKERSERHKDRERDKQRQKEKDSVDVKYRERDRDRDRERDRDKERDRDRDKDKERERDKNKERERERDKDKGRERDKERERERDRYLDKDRRKEMDKEAPSHREPRSMSKPPARDFLDAKLDEGDSSDSSRRKHGLTSSSRKHHRTEEVPSSSRRPYHEPSPLATSSLAPPQGSSNLPSSQGNPPPPTPHGMPVYLPGKEPKPHKSRHERTPSAPADPSGVQSGSDTERERAKRRELRHRTTNHANNLRGHHRELSAPVLEVKPSGSSRPQTNQSDQFREPPPARADVKLKESTGLSTQWPFSRSQDSQNPAGVKPDVLLGTSKPSVAPLPPERVKGESTAPQFVSIRAGQGPSDPPTYDLLYKPSASLHAEAPSSSARPQTHERFQPRDIPSRPDATTSSYSRSQAFKSDPPNEFGRPAMPATITPPMSQPVISKFSYYAMQPPEPSSRPAIITTASQQAAPVIPRSRSASLDANVNEPRPTVPIAKVPSKGTDPRTSVPPSPAYQNISPALQVGPSGTPTGFANASEFKSSTPLTRPLEATLEQPALPWRPPAQGNISFQKPESGLRPLEQPTFKQPSLGTPLEALPVNTLVSSARSVPQEDPKMQYPFPTTIPDPLKDVPSQIHASVLPTYSLPPIQTSSSRNADSNETRYTRPSLQASSTAVSSKRDPVERNTERLADTAAPQTAQVVDSHTKQSKVSMNAVGSKQETFEKSSLPQIYTPNLTTEKTSYDQPRVSDVRSAAPTTVSQLVAGYEARAPPLPSQWSNGSALQLPASLTASARDEKTAAPQINETASQAVLEASYHHTHRPTAPNTSSANLPYSYVGSTTHRSSPAMGSKSGPFERVQVSQPSAMDSQPSQPSHASHGLAKISVAYPSASLGPSQLYTGLGIQRPSTAMGSKRDGSPQTSVITPQVPAETSHARNLTEAHTGASINDTHLGAELSSQRPSTAIGTRRDGGEKSVLPQIYATAPQIASAISYEHNKSSDIRPAASASSPHLVPGFSGQMSTTMGSKRDAGEIPATPLVSATAPQISSEAPYHSRLPEGRPSLRPNARPSPEPIVQTISESKRNLPERHVTPHIYSAASPIPTKSFHDNGRVPEVRSSVAADVQTVPKSSVLPPMELRHTVVERSVPAQPLHFQSDARVANTLLLSTEVPTQPAVESLKGPMEGGASPQPYPSSSQTPSGSYPYTRVSESAPTPVDLKRENGEKNAAPPLVSKTQFHHPRLAELLSPPPSNASRLVPGLSSKLPADEQRGTASPQLQVTPPPAHDITSRPVHDLPVESTSVLPPQASSRSYSIPPNDARSAGQAQVTPPRPHNVTSNGHTPSPTTRSLHHRSSAYKLHPHTPPSPVHPSQSAPAPVTRSTSYNPQFGDIRSGQSRAPLVATGSQQPPSHNAVSKESHPALGPNSRHTPSPTSKPLAHRPSTHNMHSHASSRPNDTQTPPRTAQPLSAYPISSVNRSQSQFQTPYPEAQTATHVANLRIPDPSQSDTRIAPQSSSQAVPQTSYVSRSYDKTFQPSHSTQAAYPTAAIPPSSSATRSVPKASDPSHKLYRNDPSRTREPPGAVLSNAPTSSQIDPISHRSGPSNSHNAPSYQPPLSTRHQHTVSLPSTLPPPTQPVGSSRMYTNPSTRPTNPQPQATNNSQPASTSTRVPVPGHVPIPAPARAPQKIARAPSEESILQTPSSLAPSMLKPTTSRTSIPASLSSQQESREKGGIFGIFRSKSRQPQHQSHEIWHPPTSSKAPERNDLRSKAESPTKMGMGSDPKLVAPLASRGKVPSPIAVPIPINPPPSGRRSPGSKVFTPFRYLTSKRNRTMSAASVEAVDGTAPNTVVGSPTVSMHSQTPLQPPPQRDPYTAFQEWRNGEEAEARGGRGGKIRRQRPGVVFDVAEEPSQDRQRLRPVRPRAPGPSGPSRSS